MKTDQEELGGEEMNLMVTALSRSLSLKRSEMGMDIKEYRTLFCLCVLKHVTLSYREQGLKESVGVKHALFLIPLLAYFNSFY